ncbi:MAG: GAF domain-containing protein [Candidatus Sumerlaeaceae bacterium]|nr:GAF domain-containing protein [Candidatus Sumerlaeaceae bacterium]
MRPDVQYMHPAWGPCVVLIIEGNLVVSATPELADLLHLPISDLVGKSLSEIFTPSTVSKLKYFIDNENTVIGQWLDVELLPRGQEFTSCKGYVTFTHVEQPRHLHLLLFREQTCGSHILDALPEAILVVSSTEEELLLANSLQVLGLNRAARNLFGLAAEGGWENKRLTEIAPDFEKSWAEAIVDTLRTGQSQTFIGQSPNLGNRYFEIAIYPSGARTALVYLRDISKEVEYEEQLQANMRRMEHVLKSAPIILHVLRYDESRDDFVPVWISPSVEHVLGYTVEEAMAPDWWLEIMHPADREWVPQRAKEVLAKGQLQLEYRVRTKWGRQVFIQDFSRVTVVQDERPAEILVTWMDVTRRHIDAELIDDHIKTLRLLREIALAVASESTPEELARTATRKCVEAVGAKLAWIGIKKPDGRVEPLGYWPPDHPFMEGLQVRWDSSPLSRGPSGRTVALGREHIFPDFGGDPSLAPWREQLEKYQLRSGYSAPLAHRGQILGNITLYSEKTGYFTGWKAEILRDLAPLISGELSARLEHADSLQHLWEVESLRRIDLQIIADPNPEKVLNEVFAELTKHLLIEAGCFLRVEDEKHAKVLHGWGFREPLPKVFVPSRSKLYEEMLAKRSPVIVESVAKRYSEIPLSDYYLRNGYVWYCGVPVVGHSGVIGILELLSSKSIYPTPSWLALLDVFVGQCSIGMEVAWSAAKLRESEQVLRNAYDATLEGWTRALEMRDWETMGHTKRVAAFTEKLARAANMEESEIVHVRRGALLHDIGKMGVPDAILRKAGPLTEEEFEIIKKHPVFARDLLWPIEYLRPALPIPYCHHEKWDGSGYPQGLRGEEIPWPARIFAVVDVFDALSSDRPYRQAWPRDKIFAYICEQAGKHFDPRAVELFMEIIGKTTEGGE